MGQRDELQVPRSRLREPRPWLENAGPEGGTADGRGWGSNQRPLACEARGPRRRIAVLPASPPVRPGAAVFRYRGCAGMSADMGSDEAPMPIDSARGNVEGAGPVGVTRSVVQPTRQRPAGVEM